MLKMKKRTLCCSVLIIIFIFLGQKLLAQESVIPPSPTASAFGEYASVPVNQFTGKPEINIPIWNIQLKDFKLPLYLSYNINEIKVEKIASNIGLGWSLNAGGLITRAVVGMPDDFQGEVGNSACYGFLKRENANKVYDFDLYASEKDIEKNLNYFMERNSNLRSDTEPDIFYFNFAGYVGKFVIDKDRLICLIPYNNLKFSCLFNSNDNISSFTVVDEKGIKYLFDQVETTTITSLNTYYWSIFTGRINNLPSTASYTFNSSWYLSCIIIPSGERIEFSYYDQVINSNQRLFEIVRYCSDDNCQGETETSSVINSIITKNINCIKTPISKIDFIYEKDVREDLIGSKAISELKIYSKNLLDETFIKGFKFGYEYFISSGIESASDKENYKRLKLKSLTENSKNNKNKPPITFDYYYNDGLRLPNRMSFEQDVWGYYNRNGANTLIPKLYIYPNDIDRFRVYPIPDYTGETVVLPGADRTPNEEVINANVLNKINYSNGGYSKYIYESNSFLYGSNIYLGDGLRIKQIEFFDGINHDNDIITEYDYKDTYTNRISSGVLFFMPQFANLDYSDKYGYHYYYNDAITLFWHKDENGKYDQREFYYQHFLRRYNINISSLGASSINSGYGEVKKIISGKGYTISKFSFPGLYSDNSDNDLDPIINCNPSINGYCDGLYQNTKVSGQSAELFDGDCVHEWGYYGFNFLPNEYPYPPHPNYDWNRGLLLSQKDYDVKGNLVKETTNKYNVLYKDGQNHKIVYGLKIGYLKPLIDKSVDGRTCGDPDLPRAFAKFEILTDVAKVIKSSTEKIYTTSEEKAIITTMNYNFNNYNQIKSISTINSKGEETKTIFKYPIDFSYYFPLIFPDELFARSIYIAWYLNIIKNPIETTTWKDNKLVSASLQLYQSSGTSILTGFKVFPYQTYQLNLTEPVSDFYPSGISYEGTNRIFKKDSRYKLVNTFGPYDDNGNILQVSKEDDLSKSYVWGYNNQYPIAEVVNAQTNEVFYTSFEDEEDDLMSFVSSNCVSTRAHSGKKSLEYTLTDPSLSNWERRYEVFTWKEVIPELPKKYKYSGWVYSNGPKATVSLMLKRADGVCNSTLDAVTTKTNQWTYVEGEFNLPATYSGQTVTHISLYVYGADVAGKIWFDDLRLYPSDAQMTTYTYEPLVGITSVTGPDNRTTTYEYDDFGRLKCIKDNDGNILEYYDYHYKE